MTRRALTSTFGNAAGRSARSISSAGSRAGMVYDWLDDRPLDPQGPRDRGVTADRLVVTRQGHRMRIIHYTDPISGAAYEFLTNEMDLPPGVIAELYRRRWGVEKVFDE